MSLRGFRESSLVVSWPQSVCQKLPVMSSIVYFTSLQSKPIIVDRVIFNFLVNSLAGNNWFNYKCIK